MVDRLKRMKETLTSAVEAQLGNLHGVDAKELGEVVDMVKDLEEAIYYCTITKSMEEAEKKEKSHTEHHYYTPMYYRDMDRYDQGRMYYPMHDEPMYYPKYYTGQPRDSQGRFMEDRRQYSENGGSRGNGSTQYYKEMEFPMNMRDEREGRSPMSRRTYMESKEMNKDKTTKIKDLEHYMHELSEDVVDMIKDASAEEKQILEKKISALATKVASLTPNG